MRNKVLLCGFFNFFFSSIVSMKFCSDSYRILCFPFYLNISLKRPLLIFLWSVNFVLGVHHQTCFEIRSQRECFREDDDA